MNSFKKVIAFFVVLFLIFSLTTPSFAEESKTVYNEMFEKAEHVDGASAELYSDEISALFDANPELFITELSTQSDEIIDNIAFFLASGHYSVGLDEYETILNNYVAASKKEAIVLEKLKAAEKTLYNAINGVVAEGTSVSKADAFDPTTILGFIEANKEQGTIDEEFFWVIGDAYRADSKLFVETISSLSQADRNYLANGIIYTGCSRGLDIPIELGFIDADTIKETNKRIESKEFSGIDSMFSYNSGESIEQIDEETDTRVVPIPTIGTMTYTSGDLIVGTSENLRIIFTERNNTSAKRQYLVKVYEKRNNTKLLKSTKTITFLPGQSQITANFNMIFYSVGSFYTYVEVYYSGGGSVLTSRTGAYPDDVNGYWKIGVSLPTNRSYKGYLNLYNASGTSLISGECLGKSIYGYNMYTTNGDTPTGEYTGYLDGPYNSTSYGIYKVINMTGRSGVIVESGRSGIWIHGGRVGVSTPSDPWYPLYPTYGCVRVSQSLQYDLQQKITNLINSGYYYNTGNISITEN